MIRLYLLSFLSGLLILSGCTVDCNDPKAINFDESANGIEECEYGPQAVQVTMNATVNGETVIMNQNYTDNLGRQFTVETFRFYTDGLTIHATDGATQVISETDLFDFDQADTLWSNTHLYTNFELVDIAGVSFGLGLNPTVNALDPATFENSDPRSIYPGMYWTWATKYIFVKIEGRMDTNDDGSNDGAFFYHVGLDKYYKQVNEIPISVNQVGGVVPQINLEVDLMDVFFNPNDPIDFLVDGQTHTTDNEPLAERFVENLSKAVKAQ